MPRFNERSTLGQLWNHDEARAILLKYLPGIEKYVNGYFLNKMDSVPQYLAKYSADEPQIAQLEKQILTKLAAIQPEMVAVDPKPSPDYESEDIPFGSALVTHPDQINKWDVFEISLHGSSHGNPFIEVDIEASFQFKDRIIRVPGFYDGEGIYRIRFMPDTIGNWTFETRSNARSLHGIKGTFQVTNPRPQNHGPVRVHRTFHFAYEDGTPYLPIGTTCYAWTHQGEELEQQTLRTLEASPFNKIRMCVFPKSYQFNQNEPPLYPFEGSQEEGWDFRTFNPAYFRHLEKRIAQLGELGIEADLILFHAYDRWGFAKMDAASDDRYLKYLTARLAAYHNIWWSLANEYDILFNKTEEDWERFASIIGRNDPYRHLISIHNMCNFYDYSRPWITHCSIQRTDVYKTSEWTREWRERWKKPIVIDECAYEGNIDQGWGNITGQEMVRRFWEGAIRGGYVGHGETYYNEQEILWWSKGGTLIGESPDRIRFLKQILESCPHGRLEPLESEWDVPRAGIEDMFYLFYFGFNQPKFRYFHMKPDHQYKAEIIDTWEMTIEPLPHVYEGNFRIDLPEKPYMAIRLTRCN